MTGVFMSFLPLSSQPSTLGPGIYHGSFNFNSTSDDLIDNAQLSPYPSFAPSGGGDDGAASLSNVPISIALTEFHFILLYPDRIAAISMLDENLAYEEVLPLVRQPWFLVRMFLYSWLPIETR